jgi:mono/diheme cytochrome c family protein
MKSICVIAIAAMFVVVSLSLWSQDAPDGAQLYKEKCAACHGDKGQGNPDMKMPAVKGTSMTVEKLVPYITKGESEKTIHAGPVAGINKDEAKAVAEYVKSLK